MVNVQSSANPLELSFDGGTTWKTLVCVTNYNRNLSSTLTETETLNCGTLQGSGAPKFDFSGEAVTDISPSASQVSQEDLELAILNQYNGVGVPVQARTRWPATGSVSSLLYMKGAVKVESVNQKNAPNDLVKFDFSIKGTGIPELSPA
jgi:hypothetical protein